jgi:hypothetical protein
MSSKTNAKCYDLEERNYTDGLLSPDVEATYILYLEGSPRYDDINKQLDNFHPTDKVFIVHNKGFKKCDKNLKEYNPTNDLIDAYIYALNHAKENNYENILMLEDDFMFNEKIKESKHIEIIKNFLIENKNKNVNYLLGCIPYIQIPLGGYSRVLKSIGTHAVIYNKNTINKLLDNKNKLRDWDIDISIYSTKYMHHIPLCYQLITETENSKIWCEKKNIIKKQACNSVKSVYKTLNLDKSIKSYMFFYNASNILFYIFAISVSIAILFIIFYLKNN